ncbi:MAG TPA: hypothetical protein VGV59_06985 [Pyrinomonadaceae bacterium]|nr:hypothetical protein [Pyrinomonadaceae bacterium]
MSKLSTQAARWWTRARGLPAGDALTREQFAAAFERNLRECAWKPHPRYSVFTQYDQDYYLRQREAFERKYRCFYAVSKTIGARSIIELGTCAGSSADAYLSAAPAAHYLGIDVFGENLRHDDQTPWKPYNIAEALLTERGFKDFRLLRVNLRALSRLPEKAQLVVVDAAHDFENEYADLRLALTANPSFIFVDDADDELQAKPAIEKFLSEDLRERVAYTFHVEYIGGGLVIKLRR